MQFIEHDAAQRAEEQVGMRMADEQAELLGRDQQDIGRPAALPGALGSGRVAVVDEPSMGGEDFSYYGQRVPACFFVLGVCPPDRESYPTLHQPEYDFNDDALATGIEVMCGLALAR